MKIPEFKTVEEVESWIEEKELQPVSYFLDFPDAIIGITTDNALVYSMKKMVEPLENEGMNNEDAIEYLYYNTLRTLPYMPEVRPVVLDDID